MPEIDISKLAALDERDAPPPASHGPLPSSFGPPASPFAPPASPPSSGPPPSGSVAAPRFAPADEDDADAPLGVERSTRAIRIANAAERKAADAAARRTAPRASARVAPAPSADASPPRSSAGILFAILAILAVATAVFFFVTHKKPPPAPHAGISIRITAPEPTAVTIDGHAAGKTPITLQRARSTRPILIAGPRASTQVIPDHDQVIDISAP